MALSLPIFHSPLPGVLHILRRKVALAFARRDPEAGGTAPHPQQSRNTTSRPAPPIPSPAEQEERFKALIERNQPRIQRLCTSWSRSAAERDDLVAEVYFQLWRSLDSYAGDAKEDTWLYRVALNTVMWKRRGAKVHEARTDALDEQHERTASTTLEGGDALDDLLARERRLLLTSALRSLPKLDRAVLTLWLEELPYREIADITGLSTSNVGVRLHRARQRVEQQVLSEGTNAPSVQEPAAPSPGEDSNP